MRVRGLIVLIAVLGPLGTADASEVVVCTAHHYGQEPAIEAFTKKTGIQVKLLAGGTGELFERLKAEGEKTPADILLPVDAGNLWNAARAGLLSKIDSPELATNVPASLRDPDNRWLGLTVRARTIMYNTTKVKPAELSTYEALGDPKWRGRLCLRTSGYIYNQSLLATMIKRHGEARTEEIARGWAANQPVLINSDTKILEGIAAGQCDVGVTAHAKNRANAIKSLEFLSTAEAQQMFADVAVEFPANPQAAVNPIVAKWGKFKQDDTNIASAGEFQAAATRLADRAGYK